MSEQSIFLAALDIADASERTEFVRRSCAGDPHLLNQVKSLLAAHALPGEFLDVPALQQIAVGTSSFLNLTPTAKPDDETAVAPKSVREEVDLSFLQPSTKAGSLGRLSHYEVEAVIGRGGCGIVLRAFDEQLRRPVAIKVIAPELAATSPARKRFLREARAAAAIRHENVVSIHAVEETPIPFLVMEFISGKSLQQTIDQCGPLGIRQVLDVGHQIAEGLEAAHAQGLIHRDIKPANIILETGRNRVKITDFGLARTADDASLTQSGVIAGTPLYMSPEQAQGEAIDQRSDLFSLGSVLYLMISGRPPFRAATTMAVLRRVVEDQPRPIQEIIPEVPEWLTTIIAKLHAKRPDDRFESAREIADVLEHCMAELQQHDRMESLARAMPALLKASPAPSTPTALESPTPVAVPPARQSGFRRKRRWWSAAAAALVLLAAVSTAESTGATNLRGVVIQLFSPEGTLVVEVDDPAVSVSIDGEQLVIHGAGTNEIRLKPGRYEVRASRDGKLVRQELVTVTKNGRQVVRVSQEAPAQVKSKPAAMTKTGEAELPRVDAARPLSRRPVFNSGTWEVEDGVVVQSANRTPALLLFGSAEFSDIDYSCDVWRGLKDVGISLVCRATDSQHYTYAEIGGFGNKYTDLQVAEVGHFRRLGIIQMSVATDRWVPVKIKLRGKSMELFIDDQFVVHGNDDARLQGYVGLRVWNGDARFRNLKVTSPDGVILWEGPPELPTPASAITPTNE